MEHFITWERIAILVISSLVGVIGWVGSGLSGSIKELNLTMAKIQQDYARSDERTLAIVERFALQDSRIQRIETKLDSCRCH